MMSQSNFKFIEEIKNSDLILPTDQDLRIKADAYISKLQPKKVNIPMKLVTADQISEASMFFKCMIC